MVAKVSVTTVMDVAGPIEDILDLAGRYGAGVNVDCLHAIRPDDAVSGADPSPDEIMCAVASAMERR
jgi:hypothetical protein